jgi:hypothetical protein
VRDAELARDRERVGALADLFRRESAEDSNSSLVREEVQNLVGNAVREIPLLAPKIVERQDGDRGRARPGRRAEPDVADAGGNEQREGDRNRQDLPLARMRRLLSGGSAYLRL